jgi:hypothetical protein
VVEVVMGIRDRINKLLGGEAVASYDKDVKDEPEPDAGEEYRDVRDMKETEALAAFDRLSDADDSRGEADYR